MVPTWNCGPYLRPCLNSLLSQTVQAEIIVADDASTDETSEILNEYDGRTSSCGTSAGAGPTGNVRRRWIFVAASSLGGPRDNLQPGRLRFQEAVL